MVVQSRRKVTKNVASSEDRIKELEKQLEELKNIMIKGSEHKIENTMDEEDSTDDISISSDSYIKVMSLTPYLLTLTTSEYGRGKKFNFEKFGDVKRILYHDLCDIMEQHQNFLNSGYFIILSRNVVRKHGLDEVYEKILTKDKIDSIISGNDSDAVNLFKSCSNAQQELMVTMFVDKMVNNEFVDLNLLDRISRVIGYDISKRAEEIKSISLKK